MYNRKRKPTAEVTSRYSRPGYMGEELAQAYVPVQRFETTFPLPEALDKGTLFPELFRPYYPGML